MALTCPHCLRKLADSSDPADRPVFCMYCGQRLGSTGPRAAAAVLPGLEQTVDAPTQSFQADPTPDADPVRPPASEPPEVVGGYRLGRFIGAGGMGAVYEAEAVESGQRVAVKLLSGRLASNPASVERFRQEGRVASQITHPNCVFVFRADADAGRPFIAMELMPGRTLKDLVDQRGPLPVAEAIDRILDVIAGLAEAHRLGVIHRDVKPSNCFLTDDDRVKVGDFGLSKSLAGEAGDKQLTHSGAFLGTVLFASPEQIRGEPVGYESDVYAVCGTLYFLLTGRAPYQHESLTAALAKAVSEPPPPIRPRRPDVPAALERVILRGLERDRDRRWQSLEELADALRDLHPANQRPARPRSLVLAYLVDMIVLQIAILGLEVLGHLVPGLSWLRVGVLEMSVPGYVLTFLYFGLFEGRLGWTPGKRLLRLRVARVGETAPPGVPRALLRAVVFEAVWFVMGVLPEGLLEEWPRGFAGMVLAVPCFLAGLAGLLVQLRRTAHGYRGLHDFASGCRVLERPRPPHRVRLVSKFPSPLERVQPSDERLPVSVGGFAIKGKVADLPDGGEAWVGEDRSLGRRVLVRVMPAGRGDPIGADEPAARPCRLRAAGHGAFVWRGAERGWVAYVAPAGAPLADVVRPGRPLTWADARPLLEQLADELAAGEEDGSGVSRPTVEQVWVEPGGRLQLLDFPLPCAGRGGEEERGRRGEKKQGPGSGLSPPLPLSSSPPLTFVREVAALALEGRPRAHGGRVRAPLPPHASRITDRLFADDGGYAGLGQLRADLHDNHAHPPQVTAGMRAAQIGAQSMLLAGGLATMFLLSGLFSFSLAVVGVSQRQNAGDLRAMVADPPARAVLLDRVRALPDGRAEAREWMERDLSAEGAPATVRRLDELIAVQEAQVREQRRHLTRPEQVLLDRFAQVDTQASPPETVMLRNVEGILRLARHPRQTSAAERAGAFVVYAVLVVVWPLGWAAFAFAFRGGLAMRLAGITLVRPDGRRAGRLRCAARELLVWLPITALLLLALWIQATAPGLVALRTAVWFAAGLLLPVYVMVALKDPARPPQDRIMGTYLVPV